MNKSVTQVLENTAKKFPDKTMFVSKDESITYKDFVIESKKIGSFLLEKNLNKENVIIFIDKTINALKAMFGSMQAGSCYVVVDVTSPKERLEKIIDTSKPKAIITDKKNFEKCKELHDTIYILEDIDIQINQQALDDCLKNMISTDPIYILFTSGSTGVPKGSVICHNSVIEYAKAICDTFDINEDTIFGSQTPFYFSMSILDIFATVYSGATFNIIPKMYFSFPVKLMEYLNEHKINTIYWVPSALNIVANLKTLDVIKPEYLTKILFAGEAMPNKQLNIWRKALPNAMYANLFGPTEITDTCTYYIVNRDFKDDESLPIGVAFNNCDVFALKEDNTLALADEVGELVVRGSFLGLGYYNNPEKTKEAFVQNPLNKSYPELIYRTGDLVKLNEYNEYLYLGRKDFQIKHMGYRIELGEIETNIGAIDKVLSCACVYDAKKDNIVLFYTADGLEEEDLIKEYDKKLLEYMRPNRLIRLDRMPSNANGKIDRVKLKEMVSE